MSTAKRGDPRNVTNYKHGHTANDGQRVTVSQTWKCWNGMKQRCSNPKAAGYSRYGGRGIFVCERWRDSFEAFLSDMGPKPSPHHSIDRVNSDGHYEPSNCRWATADVQAKNRDMSRLGSHPNSRSNLTFRGTRESALKAWATKRAKALR